MGIPGCDFDDRQIFGDVEPTDIDFDHLDVCFATPSISSSRYQINRVRTVRNPSLWRGQGPSPATRNVVEHSLAHVSESGSIQTLLSYVHRVAPQRWHPINVRQLYEASYMIETVSAGVQVALGLAFTNFYWWKVELAFEGGLSVAIRTNPTGVRELFRLRDVPNGSNRRKALKNWVSQHWRSKHSEQSDLVFVRKHLRGSERFSWNGLLCQITPSDEALREASLLNAGIA